MIQVAAFYHFAAVPDPVQCRTDLLDFCLFHSLIGTVLLAPEGINGTVSGSSSAIESLIDYLRNWNGFHALEAKFSKATLPPFDKIRVRLKREIVAIGIEGIDVATDRGQYVAPQDWDRLISDPNVIVIDTRNDYEVAVGTFPGAINPATETFREFPDWFKKASADWQSDDEKPRIAMFCTGGIRCEKATAYVKSQGFDDVLHLQGGILQYLETIPPEHSSWQGDCFVFDDRVALGTGLKQGDQIRCDACGRAISPGGPCKDCIRPGHRAI
jgi:UPF0176 protein